MPWLRGHRELALRLEVRGSRAGALTMVSATLQRIPVTLYAEAVLECTR